MVIYSIERGSYIVAVKKASEFSLLGSKRESIIDQLLDDPMLLDINVLISDSIP